MKVEINEAEDKGETIPKGLKFRGQDFTNADAWRALTRRRNARNGPKR